MLSVLIAAKILVSVFLKFILSSFKCPYIYFFSPQNTSTPVPSTKEIYTLVRELVRSVEALWVAGRTQGLEGVIGWPSYFIKENWEDLFARIYPNMTHR